MNGLANIYTLLLVSFGALLLTTCSSQISSDEPINPTQKPFVMSDKVNYPVDKTEEEWQNQLSSEQYYVLRQAGTERPFTGKYNMHFDNGIYSCAGCGSPLFSSESKFDGHCGWPSFDKEIKEGNIIKKEDRSHNMVRTEILCSNCGSHLGHLFDDGPTSTKLRYCINSLSLDFNDPK